MTGLYRRKVTFICLALVLAGLTGTVSLEHATGQEVTAAENDVLLISSPKVLKRLSLGYSGLVADLYWTRAVQYFGRTHAQHASGYKELGPILNIAAELDPKLTITYEYGAIFLAQKPPEGAGDPKAAAALVRQGISKNPDNWHLYYTLGFIYGLELKDYRAAADVFREGSFVPGAHPWMRVMAATMAEHGGDPATAHFMWTEMYKAASEKALIENAAKHLRASEAQMDMAQLQQMVDQYRADSGHTPAYLGELVRPGYLFRLPKDPSGRYYVLNGEGRVTVQRPEDFPFLEPNPKTDPLLAMAKKP